MAVETLYDVAQRMLGDYAGDREIWDRLQGALGGPDDAFVREHLALAAERARLHEERVRAWEADTPYREAREAAARAERERLALQKERRRQAHLRLVTLKARAHPALGRLLEEHPRGCECEYSNDYYEDYYSNGCGVYDALASALEVREID